MTKRWRNACRRDRHAIVLGFSSLLLFGCCAVLLLLGAAQTQASPRTGVQPSTPSPSPSTQETPAVDTPIQPSNTSSLITQFALLLVSTGGILAAIPPIIRAIKGGKSDDDDQAKVILAMARVLAQDEHLKDGLERRNQDLGPPNHHKERRGGPDVSS